MRFPFVQALALSIAPKIWKDPHFKAAIALGLFTGIVLSLVIPNGYARAIWRDPWILISFILIQPTLEELLFRGVIQGQALHTAWGNKRYLGLSVANAFTSVLFVLLHFVHHPLVWALAVFIPSLIYGYLRERHNSLWPALVIHVFFNLTYLVAGL